MTESKYIFYGPYLTCPYCNAVGKYRLWHYNTNPPTPIADPECGACFKASCSHYDYKPSKYFADHPEARSNKPKEEYKPMPVLPVATIRDKFLKWNLVKPPYYANLLLWLQKRFTLDAIQKSVDMYLIGQRMNGCIEWPQIDIDGNIREIKMQNHDKENGHRIFDCTMHKSLRESGCIEHESRAKQCLFGEHLLRLYPDKPVCIVEGEKSAFVFSMVMPDAIWLATGGCKAISKVRNVSKHLKGRQIVVYPDSGIYAEWSIVLRRWGIRCTVSDICEEYPRNTDIIDIYFHEKYGDPIKEDSHDEECEAMFDEESDSTNTPTPTKDTTKEETNNSFINEPNVTRKIMLAEQAINSGDEVERWKAMLFLGTYTNAMQEINTNFAKNT